MVVLGEHHYIIQMDGGGESWGYGIRPVVALDLDTVLVESEENVGTFDIK